VLMMSRRAAASLTRRMVGHAPAFARLSTGGFVSARILGVEGSGDVSGASFSDEVVSEHGDQDRGDESGAVGGEDQREQATRRECSGCAVAFVQWRLGDLAQPERTPRTTVRS
jgi:hypothetical protein